MIGSDSVVVPGVSLAARRAVCLVAVAGLVVAVGGSWLSRGSGANAGRPALARAYGKLPLAFVPNRGQADPRVRLVSGGRDYVLGLSATGIELALASPPSHDRVLPSRRSRAPLAVLTGTFLGARRVTPVPSGRLPGRVNYLLGKDHRQWRTNLPSYSLATYPGLWPGIDAVFYGNQSQLEYDFRLVPGADASRIGLRYSGAQSIRLDTSGAVVLKLRGGTVRQLAPHAYQTTAGRRQPIPSHFVLGRDGRVGIHLGAYDHHQPLVVDPSLSYSTFLGGGAGDGGSAIAVDSSGNAYITGNTESSDFPTRAPVQATYRGGGGGLSGGDVFVAKLTASGALAYSTYLGGRAGEFAAGIAVDRSGDAYITGYTYSTDFPTRSPLQASNSSGAGGTAFVAKLNPSGAALGYSTYLGGSTGDQGAGIAVDGSGSAYVVGSTYSTDFPTKDPLQGTNHRAPAGGFQTDAFVAKLNPSGSALTYSTYLGGDGTEFSGSIAVDTSGNAYITGGTTSTDFPTVNPFQATNHGGSGGVRQDAFVAKLNASGSALSYSTYLGGSDGDFGHGIAVDGSGDAYIAGVTSSTDFPTQDPLQPMNHTPTEQGFVAKLNAPGSTLAYSTYLGGSSGDGATAIAVDGSGSAYVTGDAGSGDFPTKDPFTATNSDGADAFVAKLSASGTALAYSGFLGGGGVDGGSGIAVDGSGNAYVTGGTSSPDFPTQSPAQAALSGFDAFVTKISPFAARSSGVPVSLSAPAISGTPLPGRSLSCSDGSWTNAPTRFGYRWNRGGRAISGAHGRSYTVQILDEAQSLSCTVTASSAAGASAPRTSAGVLVAVKGTSHCPRPSGRLSGSTLGPLSLGMTRRRARHSLKRFSRPRSNIDDFCLYAGFGIRAGYPSHKLLGSAPAHQRAHIIGRIVLALTANPYYNLRGAKPGTRLSAIAHRLKLGKPLHLGANDWYIVATGAANGVLKIRHGTIQEIGIANKQLTQRRTAQSRLVASLYAA